MDGENRCSALKITRKPGRPFAAECTKYEDRYAGMPIQMVDKQGKVVANGVCTQDDVYETMIIVTKGIGKGCSMKLERG